MTDFDEQWKKVMGEEYLGEQKDKFDFSQKRVEEFKKLTGVNDNAVGRPILPIPTIQTFKDSVSKEFRTLSILFISILLDFSMITHSRFDYILAF